MTQGGAGRGKHVARAAGTKKTCRVTGWLVAVVPGAGLEPAHLAAGDFESPASTDFATRAAEDKPEIMAQCAP